MQDPGARATVVDEAATATICAMPSCAQLPASVRGGRRAANTALAGAARLLCDVLLARGAVPASGPALRQLAVARRR
eukprot:15421814-Alexandrium_andersonii.AAC.1